jgi:hypothetical protein
LSNELKGPESRLWFSLQHSELTRTSFVSRFAIPGVVALSVNGSQIAGCMTLPVSFGERECQVISKPFYRFDVVHLRSLIERAFFSLTQGAFSPLLS